MGLKVSFVVMVGGEKRLQRNCIDSLRNTHPGVELNIIESCGDVGCSESRNNGVAMDKGRSDVYVTLDADILFTHEVLSKIIERFENDPKLGVLGARLYHPNGTLNHAGGWISTRKADHYGKNMTDAEYSYSTTPYYCDYVTGAFFAFRKECWEALDGFDESIRFGPDDLYFCLNAWLKGWKVLYAPEVQAVHIAGGVRSNNGNHRDELKKHQFAIWGDREKEKLLKGVFNWDYNEIYKRVWEANCELYSECKTLVQINRTGARGDVLATTAAIERYKTLHPGHTVVVQTNEVDVFNNSTSVSASEKFIMNPLFRKITLDFCWEQNKSWNLYSVFDHTVNGETGSEQLRPVYNSTRDNACQAVRKLTERAGCIPPKLAIMHQAITHWISKHIPDIIWREVELGLAKAGYTIAKWGSGKDRCLWSPNGIDMRGMGIGESKELLRLADVYVGIDSFPMHLLLTTDTPGVILFTGTHPDNIVPPGTKNIYPIMANVACAGCHARQKPDVYSLECPENNGYKCIWAFDPDYIVQKALEVSRARERKDEVIVFKK